MKKLLSCIFFISFLASLQSYALEDILLQGGESIIIDDNRVVCQGTPVSKMFRCTITTAVNGGLVVAKGEGRTRDLASERAYNDCMRKANSTIACSWAQTKCVEISD